MISIHRPLQTLPHRLLDQLCDALVDDLRWISYHTARRREDEGIGLDVREKREERSGIAFEGAQPCRAGMGRVENLEVSEDERFRLEGEGDRTEDRRRRIEETVLWNVVLPLWFSPSPEARRGGSDLLESHRQLSNRVPLLPPSLGMSNGELGSSWDDFSGEEERLELRPPGDDHFGVEEGDGDVVNPLINREARG